MQNRRLDLIHRDAPPHVPRLGTAFPGVRPQPPALCNWQAAVPAWPMLANDRLGDCVPAGVLHSIQARMANAWGSSWIGTAWQLNYGADTAHRQTLTTSPCR